MLGIAKYEPNFFDDVNLFLITQKDKFEKLIGKSISRFWVMWDVKENEWYPDGPVILEIDGNNYEFCAYQLDDFSFTLNTIDLTEKLDWYGMGDELPLSWMENGKQDLKVSLNQPISAVNILTYNFKSKNIETGESHETGFMMHGIEFEIENESRTTTYFSVFNALDQNGLSSERVEQDDQIKRIKITGYNNGYK
ncbi:conserved hypothetical protein [Flavobacterium sp. 9AF]|uniref:hypothetical protein n=1 Tax=Flavobacterium sp. 9AF TaxID=2653142 RepID=UPI0012F2A801|nr:hypothetical protein [Flavobacterium sp. 9AF]VXA91537.1 conserved hypothetical protein [Flavobacterium sp. 9AF]